MKKPILAVIAGAVVVCAAALWFWFGRAQAPEPPEPPPPPADAGAGTPTIAHPLPTGSVSLPTLADSDPVFGTALMKVVGSGPFKQFVRPENLIRHIVVTVDNLAKPHLAIEQRPVAPTQGTFLVDGDDTHPTESPNNAARYAPALAALRKLDNNQLVALYLQYYPLFQSAYQDLGYPNAYFNDRLIAVIDDMLEAPRPQEPVALTRPKVMYEYADPDLEARSAGQKLLMRMSVPEAAEVKERLRALRTALIAAAPPAGPSTSAAAAGATATPAPAKP
jgi:Protein of unknown function (DUF3014)